MALTLSTEVQAEPARAGVLLFARDQATAQPYVDSLQKATVPVQWVASVSALRTRLNRPDLPVPALLILLPSPRTAMAPTELVNLALRLTAGDGEVDAGTATSALDEPLNAYCAARSLSPRQRQVLELYLTGNNDKEIASTFNCSATTVYEYWRRMAKKANGVHKSDVVNDFHRFLADRFEAVRASALAAPRRATRPPAP
ncbi:MAG: LuxR C-terminal-related transcriptional regulator [Polyangia bacterium]